MVRKPMPGTDTGTEPVVDITLPNDFGKNISLTGSLVEEEMYFNDDTGMLTMEKLYRAENDSYAYSIISAIGHSRERRAYSIRPGEEFTRVDNGCMELDLPTEILFELLEHAVRSENSRDSENSEHVKRKLAVNE
ncbi:hypothetical protein [Desulfovibrio oxyclinae]|jgi:hypothetical protein|uniref:hypothetical protein n=1 Tax=Desulfovibrio oxyclinae TaxID=63560 RepID=UPI0003623132|nr:hypothetical protein [Desulfovibrio oxyclinae]